MLQSWYMFQVGFTSKDDYFTYTWVKDQEVGFSEEAIQVVIIGAVVNLSLMPFYII